MRFLVIGGSGFVGRNLLTHLKSEGFPALGTQCTSKKPDLVSFDLFKDRIQDCVDREFFNSGEPVVGVITAGISQVDRCFQERETTHVVNVENTIQLIQDMRNLGVKPLFISSHAVFDGETGYDDEERPKRPISEYGRQKEEVERFIEEYAPDVLVYRLDKVVGDNPEDAHMFSEWHKWIMSGQTVTCIQGQLFAPTHVQDIAKAIVLCCQRGLTGIFNLAGPEFFSREELARQFAIMLGREALIVSKPMEEFGFKDPRPLKSYLDSTKFVKATGMRFTSMREVMNSFIQNTQATQSSAPAAAGQFEPA